MIIIIDDYNISLERENASFLIQKPDGKHAISPHRVRAIHVRKPCTLSSPVILLAAEHDIPILFFNTAGKVKARLWQAHFGSHARIRHMQMAHARHPEGLAWVRGNIGLKADAQCEVLKWLANRVPAQATDLQATIAHIIAAKPLLQAQDASPEAIRAIEARIARLYWEAYFAALEKHSPADKRSRRPASNPLNALLNYGYGMLYGEVETAALTAGLDPHIGILHREEHGKPAFVFDAIEPYRPWVDRLVAELAIGGQISSTWFEAKPQEKTKATEPVQPPTSIHGTPPAPLTEDPDGPERETLELPFWLSREGKAIFIPAWLAALNTATAFAGKKIKRRDQIQAHLTQLAQHLLHTFTP